MDGNVVDCKTVNIPVLWKNVQCFNDLYMSECKNMTAEFNRFLNDGFRVKKMAGITVESVGYLCFYLEREKRKKFLGIF